MSTLTNKRILLGVTGGIAAYKSAELLRLVQNTGAEVRVVMTQAAQEFITPLTFQALSGKPVHTDLLNPEAEAAMGHIELARWADAIVIAPATADFIARLAHGEGSDLLSTLCLASRAKLLIAPAMNQVMWGQAATQDNLGALTARGVSFIGPATGSQACGDVGPGRMSEVAEIQTALEAMFDTGLLEGKRVLITAGPTREAIDPVRYISNHSSGKMGYALAEAAAEAGALTCLISGPVSIPAPERVQLIQVESALEMHAQVMEQLEGIDIFIGAAAVADYRPIKAESAKIKKGKQAFQIEFTENPDILAEVASNEHIYTVGFAAETSDLEAYARAKLLGKKLNMIVANDVSRKDIGFNSDNNALTVIHHNVKNSQAVKNDELFVIKFEEASKTQLAQELMQLIAKNIGE